MTNCQRKAFGTNFSTKLSNLNKEKQKNIKI